MLSGVTLAPKKDGDLRFCCAYVGLNSRTIPDKYPLPQIDEILEEIASYEWYSIVDGFCGYYALKLTEESRPLTAFLTHFGIFVEYFSLWID